MSILQHILSCIKIVEPTIKKIFYRTYFNYPAKQIAIITYHCVYEHNRKGQQLNFIFKFCSINLPDEAKEFRAIALTNCILCEAYYRSK